MTKTLPLRILHLASSERWTGVAEPSTSVAWHHARSGLDVRFACIPERSFEQELRRTGLPVAAGINLARQANPFRAWGEVLRLRAYLERENPDVVHCHLLHDHWMAALAIRGMRGKRPVLVRTVHRYEPMRRDPLHRGLFERHTQVVTTVSSEQQRIIGAAYPGLGGRLVLVHGGVNPERFRPDMAGAAAVRADLGEKPDACVAGIVAHLGYNRGHRWLLEAAPAALARAPKGTIWIVGQGELKYDLREQVKRAEFRGQVIMTGYRGEDLPDVYAAMDAGLLLGLGSEGSARAAMEAMSAGRPVIGVRKGALLDLIRDGENGFLVAENDVRGLADALGRLLADRPLARTMGEAARKTILAGFTEETRAARTLAIYEKALAGRD